MGWFPIPTGVVSAYHVNMCGSDGANGYGQADWDGFRRNTYHEAGGYWMTGRQMDIGMMRGMAHWNCYRMNCAVVNCNCNCNCGNA